MKEALYWESLGENKLICRLCPHQCRISEDTHGICRARKNVGGRLYSLVYGKVTSIALDPIEKKPLYHFYPGSYILSVGSYGCNFKCSFCQNWSIAHGEPDAAEVSSDKLAAKALELKCQGNIGIAFTYNEPSVWFEFILDTAKKVREAGLKNVLVTNGYINTEPLLELLPHIDAMNIDVKAFTDKYYREICRGSLEHVKKTVETAAKHCHVEITTLIVPGLNDAIEEIGGLAVWLASINKDIPLHLSRFFPNYKMKDILPTSRETLIQAREEALKHLNHVHLGNIH